MSEQSEIASSTPKTPIEIPPVNLQTIYLGGLFILALLTCCYFAKTIIMPIVMACLLKLVFQPIMRLLEKWKIPHNIAALLIIAASLGITLMAITTLYTPATLWIHDLPQQTPKIQSHLNFGSSVIIVGKSPSFLQLR